MSTTSRWRTLRTLREIGEECYREKARVLAGDSNARRVLADVCREHGIDLDDALARDDASEVLKQAEAAELHVWELLDRLRKVIESQQSELQRRR
jgi:hypothetical protein